MPVQRTMDVTVELQFRVTVGAEHEGDEHGEARQAVMELVQPMLRDASKLPCVKSAAVKRMGTERWS